MNEQLKQEKVRKFLADAAMSEIVFQVLLQSFLKKRETDTVEMKAAERIAIDLLQEGWKELEKIKNQSQPVARSVAQVGM